METKQKTDLAKYRLKQAEESLKDAELLLRYGRFASAVNRCYYVVFYASQALLLLKNLSFQKHSANMAAFLREFVKPGSFSVETSKILKRLFYKRTVADYGDFQEFKEEETQKAVSDAKTFLHEAEKLFEQIKKP